MTGVNVSTPLLVAAVAQTQASAGVSASSFTATPTIVSAAVAAYLDYRGLNKKRRDSVLVTESAILTIAKTFADTYGVSDFSSFFVHKRFTDSVGTTDVVTVVKFFLRDFTETAAISENIAVNFIKPLTNFVGLSQVLNKATTKILADAVGLNDSAELGDGGTYTFDKSVNNVAFVGDSASISAQPSYFDLVSIGDSSYYSVAKGLQDTASVADGFSYVGSPSFADIATTQEQKEVEFARPLSSSVGMSDSTVAFTLKYLMDIFNATSAGALVSQSYCDSTYFETDYTGEYRTFS